VIVAKVCFSSVNFETKLPQDYVILDSYRRRRFKWQKS